jgi:hypothetical protein
MSHDKVQVYGQTHLTCATMPLCICGIEEGVLDLYENVFFLIQCCGPVEMSYSSHDGLSSHDE